MRYPSQLVNRSADYWSRLAHAKRRALAATTAWHRSGSLIASLICVPLVLLRIRLLLSPLPLYDFIIYWTSGRLFLAGVDPYSSSAVLGVERSLGWPYAQPMVMFLPPWSLPFGALLGLMPFQVAHVLWLAASFVIDGMCSIGLWRYFGGHKKSQAIALVILASYISVGTAEYMGQVTPLILAGLTIFLFSIRHRRYLAAGVCLLALSLKPHLLLLVILSIVLWTIQHRRWVLAANAAAVFAVIATSVVGYDRNVLGYFHDTYHQAMHTSCGVGGVLRSIWGEQHAWLSFLPTVFGFAWFAQYWMKRRRQWSWEEHLPLVLLVSLITAPYFWAHDFLLALPSVIAFAVKVESARVSWRVPAALYFAVQLAIIGAGGKSKAWMATASLLWLVFYCAGTAALRQLSPCCSEPLPVAEMGRASAQGRSGRLQLR